MARTFTNPKYNITTGDDYKIKYGHRPVCTDRVLHPPPGSRVLVYVSTHGSQARSDVSTSELTWFVDDANLPGQDIFDNLLS